jgi:hypothetical protein
VTDDSHEHGRPAPAGLPTAAPPPARVELVQRHVRAFLDSGDAGSRVRVVCASAGRGLELLPVLAAHRRRADVRARLIDLDPANIAAACELVAELRLDWNVELARADASTAEAFAGAVPADLLLLRGVFARLPLEAARTTVDRLPELCAAGATVIWAHDRAAEAAWELRGWLERTGFAQEDVATADCDSSVTVYRFGGTPIPLSRGARLFAP